MSSQVDGVTRALKRLQGLVRQPRSGGPTARSGRVPDDIATAGFPRLYLEPEAGKAYQEAHAAVFGDRRLEYLDQDMADKALWRFACQCSADRATDHVAMFIREHARDVLDVVCYLPVEHLNVETETTAAAGLRLLPMASDEVPRFRGGLVLAPPVGCVAAVGVSGTSYERMAERARAVAEHGLRVLRIALRAERGIHDDQLRFGLGETYAFDDQLSGWARRPGAAVSLTLVGSGGELAGSQAVTALPAVPRSKLERKAGLAVRWIERAMLATEPLDRLLYLFFALETLLGDKGEGEKAGLIALRRAMLGHIMGHGFTHPSNTYRLYDEVRSAAVHGSEPPEVTEAEVRLFAADVREALDQYLRYGQEASRGKASSSQSSTATPTDPSSSSGSATTAATCGTGTSARSPRRRPTRTARTAHEGGTEGAGAMSPAHEPELASLASQFRSFELDVTLGRAVVHLADGRTAAMRVTTPSPADSTGIARIVYSPADHALAITTPGGESATMEIEAPGGTAQRAGRRVVYLDQGHWSTLARHASDPGSVSPEESAAADKLITWARDRRILLPLSSGHVVETTPLYAAKRQRLALTMLQLSRGWHMRNPVLVRRDEIAQVLAGTGPVPGRRRPEVFAPDADSLFATPAQPEPELAGLPGHLNWLCGRLTAVAANFDLLMDPERIEPVKTTGWCDEMTALGRNAQFQALPTARRRVAGRLRALLDAVSDKPDMLYLACAAAYADGVAAEHAAAQYLSAAWRGRPMPCPVGRPCEDSCPILSI